MNRYVGESGYDLTIDVSDLTVSSVGDYTVNKIVKILKDKEVDKKDIRVQLDFTGLTIIGASNKNNIGLLMNVIIHYNCDIVGLSELVEEELICYLHSDKYIIDTIGEKEYLTEFKRSIDRGSPMRLRVKDNFYTNDFVRKELLINVGFKDNEYHYLRIKPCYAEPKFVGNLPFDQLFELVKIHQSDLLLNEYRIRDSVGEKEYQIIRLFDSILEQRKVGEYIFDILDSKGIKRVS